MPCLKIHIVFDGGWGGDPSAYYPDSNSIIINPYYSSRYPSWMWFIPLTHEVFHWLIERIFPKAPPPPSRHITRTLHVMLDRFHPWLMDRLSGMMYWDHPIAHRNRQIIIRRNLVRYRKLRNG